MSRIKECLIDYINNTDRTIHQISQESKINHLQLYRVASGERKNLGLQASFRLADALGVDINEFREDEEDESRQ